MKEITSKDVIVIPYVLVYLRQIPTKAFCNLTAAWHIQKDSYSDKINFDGLNVVALFHSPGNMLTGPKWDAALYIDERASKEQTDSLATIYSGQVGGFFAVASINK